MISVSWFAVYLLLIVCDIGLDGVCYYLLLELVCVLRLFCDFVLLNFYCVCFLFSGCSPFCLRFGCCVTWLLVFGVLLVCVLCRLLM